MLFYFSDGCAGQYKNCKNFINLCHHCDDFGLDAEWIFFVTSHGKSPCDGIGGFVKRHVAKRSLQHPLNNQILDHKAMINLCIKEIKDIEFIEISQEEMQVVRASLKERFDASEMIPGTRKSHHFIPQSKSKLMHKLTSEDNTFLTFDFLNVFEKIDLVSLKNFSYIACIYEDFWWIGMVSEVNIDEQDVMVEFLHPHRPQKNFKWPRNPDRCLV